MLKTFWQLILRRHRWAIAGIGAASIVESVLQVANLSMIIPLVLVILGQTNVMSASVVRLMGPVGRFLTGRPPFEAALWLAGATLTLVVLKNAVMVARSYLAFKLYIAVRTDITLQLFTRYLHARFADLSQIPRGTILYNLAQPPGQVAEVTRAASEALASVVQMAALTSLLVVLSWRLTLIAGITAGATLALYQLVFSRRIQRVRERIFDVDSRAYQWSADAIDGIREVKAFAAQAVVVNRLRELYCRMDTLEGEHGRLRYLPAPLNEIVSTATALGLFVAATFVTGFRIPAAYVVTFILALQRIGPAFANLLTQKTSIDAATKNLAVVVDVLSTLPLEQPGGDRSIPSPVETITLEHASYVYPSRGQVPAVKDVTVQFRRGQVTAIVGPSGAGKSTLADLIVRLIEPTSGRLLANGRDLVTFELAAWRRQIGLVSQDSFLFNASIRDNIALSNPGASLEEVTRAAAAARIDEFIRTLPDGYDTLVGNRGAQLSGGQRQRVAIARALLSRPAVMVFDEATSALDNLSERLVRETIEEFRHSAVVVVIAHRASSVEAADAVVVLDKGQVQAQGSHAELLREGGLYGTMYPSLQKSVS